MLKRLIKLNFKLDNLKIAKIAPLTMSVKELVGTPVITKSTSQIFRYLCFYIVLKVFEQKHRGYIALGQVIFKPIEKKVIVFDEEYNFVYRFYYDLNSMLMDLNVPNLYIDISIQYTSVDYSEMSTSQYYIKSWDNLISVFSIIENHLNFYRSNVGNLDIELLNPETRLKQIGRHDRKILTNVLKKINYNFVIKDYKVCSQHGDFHQDNILLYNGLMMLRDFDASFIGFVLFDILYLINSSDLSSYSNAMIKSLKEKIYDYFDFFEFGYLRHNVDELVGIYLIEYTYSRHIRMKRYGLSYTVNLENQLLLNKTKLISLLS